MLKEVLPNITKKIQIPGGNFEGVYIVTAATVIAVHNPVEINGVFNIPQKAAEEITGSLHKALACVIWTISLCCTTLVPFRNYIVFPKDEEYSNFERRGYFNFRLNGEVFNLKGIYYCHMALGSYLSNSLVINAQ